MTVHAVYGLALRQTEGFLRSVARFLQLDIEIPDHSTLSRRSLTLKAPLRNTGSADSPVNILIDSTGLKAHRGSTAPASNRVMQQGLELTARADRARRAIFAEAEGDPAIRAIATTVRAAYCLRGGKP